MSKRTAFPKARLMLALLVSASALAAVAWGRGTSQTDGETSPGVSLGPHVRTFHYSTHTFSAGQTARLTAVNPVLVDPPDPVAPGGIVPCIRVTLAFDVYAQDTRVTAGDLGGASAPPQPVRLSFVRRVERVAELEPGEGASFEYTPAAGETVSPVTFVAEERETNPPDPVREGETNPPEPVRASAVTSLEVRQNGATLFVLPGTARGFNPQPDPPRER